MFKLTYVEVIEPEFIEEEPVSDNDVEDTTYSQDGEEEIPVCVVFFSMFNR